MPPAVCIGAWHIKLCLCTGFTCVWVCIFHHCWECSGQALSNRPRLWAAHRSYSGEWHCHPCHTPPHTRASQTLGELLRANQKLSHLAVSLWQKNNLIYAKRFPRTKEQYFLLTIIYVVGIQKLKKKKISNDVILNVHM